MTISRKTINGNSGQIELKMIFWSFKSVLDTVENLYHMWKAGLGKLSQNAKEKGKVENLIRKIIMVT